jgi:gliding motility-associated-like protein
MFSCLALGTLQAQSLHFSGTTKPALTETPPASTGLNAIYLLRDMDGDIRVSYTAASASAKVTWQRFNALGGGYAEEVASTRQGTESTLSKLEGNMGYIVTEDGKSSFFWVVNYAEHELALRDVTLSRETDCGTTWLDIDGNGERIPYYSITGVPQWLDRDLTLTYSTLDFDESTQTYRQTQASETIDGFTETIHCTPPLCETSFTLSGDKFLRSWGEEASFISPIYEPTAVDAHTWATQAEHDYDNEVKVDAELGGSGPVEVHFAAAVTDAALYHMWEISSDSEFNFVSLQYSDLEFDHTFSDQGTTYVRFTAANGAGECEFQSDVYQVFIGESSLQCPNAFSPGTSEGVNDEWKVSYKSITEFDCHIFDRHGRQMAHLTHPSQSWDGKRGGKAVPTGVYFYVIKAVGTDGKKYNLSGDINVVGFSRTPSSSSTSTTTE